MSRTIPVSAAIIWVLIKHAHAGIQQNGSTDSILRGSSVSRLPSSCGESICARTLTSASLGLDLVGGGSGNISLSTKDDDAGSDDEGVSTAIQEHTTLKGGATVSPTQQPTSSDLNAMPLRISSGRGKQVSRETRMDMRMQKKLERRRCKEEEESHRVYAKKNLKNRNHLNLSRKVFHAGFGLVFATLNHILPRETFVPGMIFLSTGTLAMELLRYRKGFGWMNDALIFCLGGTLRKHELEGKFTGSFYYFVGVTITAACFPTSCATLGICQLALADPSASFFGRQTKDVYWSRIEK